MWHRGITLFICICCAVFFTACKTGTSSLFIHPKEQGYEYEVTYDVLGGHINQMKTRTVYYAKDSLLFEPSGNSGMLVEPKNGNKTLLGWYTAYEKNDEKGSIQYSFHEDDRWDFANMRVNEKTAPKHNLHLYARWGDNPTIRFVEKASDTNPLLTWTIDIGTVLKRPTSAEPTKANSTLVDYYVDEAFTTKYEFNHEITEDMIQYDSENNAYLNVYCKFIEGDYIRIKTIKQLKDLSNYPEGNYLLANDLDLKSEQWEAIENFSGVFDGNGYCIRNMNINAKNKVAGLAAKNAPVRGYGLFANLDHAIIRNLNVQDATIQLDSTSNVGMSIGIVAGIATNSEFENIMLKDNVIYSDQILNVDLTLAEIAPCDRATKLNDNVIDGLVIQEIKTKGVLIIVDN